MWDTSNRDAFPSERHHKCSFITPPFSPLYKTGSSYPAKGTMSPPISTCKSYKAVFTKASLDASAAKARLATDLKTWRGTVREASVFNMSLFVCLFVCLFSEPLLFGRRTEWCENDSYRPVIIVAAGPWTDTSEKKIVQCLCLFFLTPSTPPTIVNCIIKTSFYTLLKPFEACRLII